MPENEQPQPQQPPQPLDISFDLADLDAPSSVDEDRESKRERKLLFGEPKRHEQFQQVVHVARLVLLSVVLVAILAVFVIRVLHFVLPENNAANAGTCLPHGWLTDGQLSSIDKFVFGAISAFVGQHLFKAIIFSN